MLGNSFRIATITKSPHYKAERENSYYLVFSLVNIFHDTTLL